MAVISKLNGQDNNDNNNSNVPILYHNCDIILETNMVSKLTLTIQCGCDDGDCLDFLMRNIQIVMQLNHIILVVDFARKNIIQRKFYVMVVTVVELRKKDHVLVMVRFVIENIVILENIILIVETEMIPGEDI